MNYSYNTANSNPRFVHTAAMMLAICLVAGSALGQGQIFITPGPDGQIHPALPTKQHLVDVEIEDQVAETTIEQVFFNSTGVRQEGTYVFPVPTGVSISKLTMMVNGEPVSAKVIEAKKARDTYEAIVRQQRDPALLEYVGRDLVKLRVFPIEPNSDTKVTIEYQEVLPFDQDVTRYRFGFTQAGKASETMTSSRIKIKLKTRDELKTIYSPTHDIDIDRDGNRAATIRFSDEDVKHEKDFELVFGVSPDDVALHLLTYRDDDDEDGYFMLLANPREGLEEDQQVAKRVVFVIDCSGSMRDNDKIKQAKNALEFCLSKLNERDHFGLITFSDEVEKLSSELLPAKESDVQQALEKVGKIEADGGTNIDEALEEALQMLEKDEESPAYVLFLTDGKPTVGEQNIPAILEHTKKENDATARMFVFGVGFDVNTELLDSLSTEHRGVVNYVRPKEDIEVAISSLYGKISKPVLADPKLDFGDIEVSKVYPKDLSDVFAGQQLVVLGRYDGDGSTKVELFGKALNKTKKYSSKAKFAKESDDYDFIPRLWAARRIGYLAEAMQKNGDDQELKDEIISLSKEFGIVTPWTSMMIDEDMPEMRRALSAVPQEESRSWHGLSYNGPAVIQEGVMASSIDGIPPIVDEDANGNVTVHADFGDNFPIAPDKAGNRAQVLSEKALVPVGDANGNGFDVNGYAPAVDGGENGQTNYHYGASTLQVARAPRAKIQAELSPEAAVARSMTIQGQLKGAEQLGDAMVFFDTNGNRQTVQGLKQVGKATFYQAGLVWVQDGFDFKADEKKLIKIKPFSPAYFDLLKAVPDLAPVLALGDIIYLHHQGHQIVITDEGVEALDAELLAKIQKPA